MPQLDFTMWSINLLISWLMFLLVFTSTKNISGMMKLNSKISKPKTFSNSKWVW